MKKSTQKKKTAGIRRALTIAFGVFLGLMATLGVILFIFWLEENPPRNIELTTTHFVSKRGQANQVIVSLTNTSNRDRKIGNIGYIKEPFVRYPVLTISNSVSVIDEYFDIDNVFTYSLDESVLANDSVQFVFDVYPVDYDELSTVLFTVCMGDSKLHCIGSQVVLGGDSIPAEEELVLGEAEYFEGYLIREQGVSSFLDCTNGDMGAYYILPNEEIVSNDVSIAPAVARGALSHGFGSVNNEVEITEQKTGVSCGGYSEQRILDEIIVLDKLLNTELVIQDGGSIKRVTKNHLVYFNICAEGLHEFTFQHLGIPGSEYHYGACVQDGVIVKDVFQLYVDGEFSYQGEMEFEYGLSIGRSGKIMFQNSELEILPYGDDAEIPDQPFSDLVVFQPSPSSKYIYLHACDVYSCLSKFLFDVDREILHEVYYCPKWGCGEILDWNYDSSAIVLSTWVEGTVAFTVMTMRDEVIDGGTIWMEEDLLFTDSDCIPGEGTAEFADNSSVVIEVECYLTEEEIEAGKELEIYSFDIAIEDFVNRE